MKHTIYISVGSNVDKETHTVAGLQAMYEAFGDLELSSVYESEAVGFEGSNFYNLVVGAKTEHSVSQVCKILKQIETNNGRQRSEKKFAPRTLDLDLLLYDDVITQDGVILPREEIAYNAFVLLPLNEIAAELMHPTIQQNIGVLWSNYHNDQQKLWKIDFNWSPRKP